MPAPDRRTAYAPGRVNLIGDHTDYTGGLVLPVAIDKGTTVRVTRRGSDVHLVSADEPHPAIVTLPVTNPALVEPAWARYVAGVVKQVNPSSGAEGTVATTLPVGSGLSSSAALEVAVALALGFDGDALALAQLCQRAEQEASGVPSGIMDQLASAAGVDGHALLIDCRALTVTPVGIPPAAAVVVVPSGQTRTLAGSAYAERRAQCEAAEAIIGPLRDATPDAAEELSEPVLRRRARHVVTENARVTETVDALVAGDLPRAGAAMGSSHASLRDDFEVSTPTLDNLVERLVHTSGVFGARLTGGGFGGCSVALVDAAAAEDVASQFAGFRVRASAGARVID